MRIRKRFVGSLLIAVAACAVNPATGRREFMLVSEASEIQMGREADPQVAATYGIVDDAALQSYVSGIGQRMASSSERPDLPWSFKVVDDPIVNAFALPGGFIYVTRGILAYFDSEAELAGVVGHEIGHVTARHSAAQMSRQQLQQIGVGLGMVLSERFRQYGGIALAGLQIMNLKYSRGDESEADRLGLGYMSGAGYDADGMIGVFEMLAQVSGGGEGRLPEWQLTHPYPENREAQIREEIANRGIPSGGTVNRDALLDHIDGLVYGDDPRQGYFEGSRFFHPDLAFELTFPSGWTTVNQRSSVGAISPGEDAVVVLGVADGVTDAMGGLRDFLAQEGISGGPGSETSNDGIRVARSDFEATTDNGTLSGEVAFLRYGDVTYRMIGYAASADWGRYSAQVAATISSFAEVTDRRVLGVQPLRLSIVRLSQAMSLNSFVQQSPQPIDIEDLARLNRVAPGSVLSAGTRIKTVVGTPVG